MKKAFKWISIILIILVGTAAGYYGMGRWRGQDLPAFVYKIPVVGSHIPHNKTASKQLSPLEKTNQQLKDQITRDELQLKTYQDRVKALELANQALQTENTKLQQQQKAMQSAQNQGANGGSSLDANYKDMAKYFEAMKAKDAAKILEQRQMDDDTIIGILQYMDKDSAASILSLLDPARAATITKKMLQ